MVKQRLVDIITWNIRMHKRLKFWSMILFTNYYHTIRSMSSKLITKQNNIRYLNFKSRTLTFTTHRVVCISYHKRSLNFNYEEILVFVLFGVREMQVWFNYLRDIKQLQSFEDNHNNGNCSRPHILLFIWQKTVSFFLFGIGVVLDLTEGGKKHVMTISCQLSVTCRHALHQPFSSCLILHR